MLLRLHKDTGHVNVLRLRRYINGAAHSSLSLPRLPRHCFTAGSFLILYILGLILRRPYVELVNLNEHKKIL